MPDRRARTRVYGAEFVRMRTDDLARLHRLNRALNVVPFAQRSESAALAIPKSRADFRAHVVHAQNDAGRVWRISADDADRS